MKQRLSDYVADFLVDHGVTDCFTVVGGGAMHLNDALGHKQGLKCTYNHHEQASAIAAEAYARIHNKIAALCVTTGPGGTNAITGVVGGWLDSIPMFVLSGQVRYDTTARYAMQACPCAPWAIRSLISPVRWAVCANTPPCWKTLPISAICWKRHGIWPQQAAWAPCGWIFR